VTQHELAGWRKSGCGITQHEASLMSVLLQISDTHFGTEQQSVIEALVRLSLQQRPDLLVLSGDITQRARKVQFRAARAFVDRLNVPVLAIPGNHDIPLFDLWTRLRRPYARHCAAFGQVLEPMHSSPDMLVVCVNTTRWYRHKNGEVSEQQIERVAQRLTRASRAQLRVVVVHQPVAVKHAGDEHDLLRGRAEAIRHWAAAGVDLLMGGHIHLPYVVAVPNIKRSVWAVQAGTAVSSRVRSGVPNSVNIIRCGQDAPDGCCVIEQWDYASEGQAFVRVDVTSVRPG
jgi:3',5'-cyclic AMP phosphodiesterase CpdA